MSFLKNYFKDSVWENEEGCSFTGGLREHWFSIDGKAKIVQMSTRCWLMPTEEGDPEHSAEWGWRFGDAESAAEFYAEEHLGIKENDEYTRGYNDAKREIAEKLGLKL